MDVTAGEVSAGKVRVHQCGGIEVRSAEVRPAEVRVNEVRCIEDRPAEVRPAEVRLNEVSLAEARPAEVCVTEVRPGEDRLAEVRLAEVRPAKVRLAKVWTDVEVLETPRVPGGHALLEHRDVLVVRHGSTLSATTLFWDGLTTRSIRLASLHADKR